MKRITILLMAVFCFTLLSFGKVRVVTSYRYIADIAQRIGGEEVSVNALAPGSHDPHFITPKPSFIAKLRKADLLIINGGQLEVGWLPPVIRQANNPKIAPGGQGFLMMMDQVEPIDVHTDVSRARGDVHPEGNPHIQLDPHNIPLFAKAITDKLCQLDSANCPVYTKNYDKFREKWSKKTAEWDEALVGLKGIKVVEYHKVYDYLFHRYHIHLAGTLEPLPGIPPTTRHIAGVIDMIKTQKVPLILQDVYHSSKTARFVSGKTGAKLAIIPHDVGAVKEATDIFSLFDELVRRLIAP
ncbi:MAG: zinc ABC transporter solute-binding protein [bacterium]|nr:zinc ABC transporter solute-binding protein [bacterium]